ncbi:uncharacterized protein C8Q71DRAFT_780986 [Rhodofomes roseus]|uniref:F-box domain-containing protein n=1 Tax=Rhodofomes roseus TaxID=34475 RepID=A0ABQ8K3V1_9APHY|nr:uncharacterized protein C8Q71DRAFT_780986 [Rhodofomes roseus]KAH9831524.1 hypothetical protein C8Q71DRAFT_780986 [Rhodofomes roseus]
MATEEVDTLRRLNADVLLQVFEYLRPMRGLRPLSMSCRWIRGEVTPVLFRACLVKPKKPICAERFLPRSLWPHVLSLSLIDNCPDLIAMRDPEFRIPQELRFTNDPLLCGIMVPAFLATTLRAMPRLRSVCLAFFCREIHGMGWDTLAAILSTPQLRHFTLAVALFSPRQNPTPMDVKLLAPITTFRYLQTALRAELRDYPSQETALGLVVGALRDTLECLQLPSEVTPFGTLAGNLWPRLTQLHLLGEVNPTTDLHAPLVTLLAGMPSLRVLRLDFALPNGVDRKVLQLWPENYEAQLPWPQLDDLTVSFPSPGDQIYSYLPQSLQRLSLRCTPHHFFRLRNPYRFPFTHSPILRASEMLEILTKIAAPRLQYLQLEYCADAAEDDLMLCVSQRFLRLTFLEIHRYSPRDGGCDTVSSIALHLAKLGNLDTLRVYLEHEDGGALYDSTPIRPNAALLASRLPGLKMWLLQEDGHNAAWVPIGPTTTPNVVQMGDEKVMMFPFEG